ncbi:disease resistance protein RPV1-like [Prosopis cineraria]|uniref:disease resistance protein RPV1-like n=1 Tax=Prosopis cineraria TaxID=364024 RepID=UPI0024106117|nr:disease resistance protein RPV1-like [Prosopis cineraria]
MSSSSLAAAPTHEVFISVQNDDPSKYIADMIDRSLTLRGVPTFKDERRLREKQKGTNLGRDLKEAIAMSKISIVMLSENYVYSSWCLEELVVILQNRQKWGLIVLPIFYEMDPSDIRKQRGDAFKIVNAQRKGGVWEKRWKSALKEAANLCGWDHRGSNRIESLLVGKLVEDIVNKRIPTNLSISIYPLRYDTIHQYLNMFLQVGMHDVLVVGICGESGMGKTVIARAIYDQISFTFEGSSFLENVGQKTRMPDGLVQLQEKLLSDTLSTESKVGNVSRGMDMIEKKLCSRRVLIVVDGVDDLEQLYALVWNRSWFGLGSKIIITTRTRDLWLLNKLGVDQVYLAQGLPLPSNIQTIWNQFQLSNHMIAGLKHYILLLQQTTIERERNLRQYRLKLRQKNAIQEQVIANLKQTQGIGLIKDK